MIERNARRERPRKGPFFIGLKFSAPRLVGTGPKAHASVDESCGRKAEAEDAAKQAEIGVATIVGSEVLEFGAQVRGRRYKRELADDGAVGREGVRAQFENQWREKTPWRVKAAAEHCAFKIAVRALVMRAEASTERLVGSACRSGWIH